MTEGNQGHQSEAEKEHQREETTGSRPDHQQDMNKNKLNHHLEQQQKYI